MQRPKSDLAWDILLASFLAALALVFLLVFAPALKIFAMLAVLAWLFGFNPGRSKEK